MLKHPPSAKATGTRSRRRFMNGNVAPSDEPFQRIIQLSRAAKFQSGVRAELSAEADQFIQRSTYIDRNVQGCGELRIRGPARHMNHAGPAFGIARRSEGDLKDTGPKRNLPGFDFAETGKIFSD